MKETLFQICIYLTICMFVFTLAIQYVSGLGIYETEVQQGLDVTGDSDEVIRSATESADRPQGFNITTMWALVLTAAGAVGLVVAWITHSTAIIGVFIFSTAFWASYVNTLGILNIGLNASTSYLDPNFTLIATAGMGMVWIGAVAGMLSGSG